MGILLDAKRRTAGRRTIFVCSKSPPSTRVPTWVILAVSAIFASAILVPPLGRQVFTSPQRPLPGQATPLIQFHKSLSDIDRRLETASAKYRETSSIALRSRNLLGLFDATNEYEATLDSLHKQALSVDPPHARNAATDAWAVQAREILVQRVIALRSANHLMVEAVNSGEINDAAIQAIEMARASVAAKYKDESGALRRGYEALGISHEAIPPTHGSLDR